MDIPPETSIRWALTQRLSSVNSEAIIGPMSSTAVLLRFADKEPLKFAGAILLFLGASLAALIQLLRYWR